MPQYVVMTPEDRQILQGLIDREKRSRTNVPRQQRVQQPAEDQFGPEVYIAEVPSGGIAARQEITGDGTGTGISGTGTEAFDSPGSADCTIYELRLDDSGSGYPRFYEVTDFEKRVYNYSTGTIPAGYIAIARTKYGEWIALTEAASTELVGFKTTEDHPGRGTLFDVYLGTWDPAEHDWDYDTGTTYKCVDWRYDVPAPDAGATGLAVWRTSNTYTSILEVVSMDCDTPGTGTGA